ncbi:Zn-dependent protease, putative [Babesia ovata]|uniref:Zn-dependent protease, putative n=1 Tax=Babesia ovata TaxID=189622 RepID=A0A2H6KK20_9APIC|nr:Zn-dependent protease, putative [Babesia ovata]GBE63331.1 Zn-dependent protease, putative [Babesia ovata]
MRFLVQDFVAHEDMLAHDLKHPFNAERHYHHIPQHFGIGQRLRLAIRVIVKQILDYRRRAGITAECRGIICVRGSGAFDQGSGAAVAGQILVCPDIGRSVD